MQNLKFIVALLCVLAGGCSFVVEDTPELRGKMGEIVVEVPPLPTEDTCLDIKLNINAQGEKIAHPPTSPNYNQVEIDKEGESYVCTVEEAEAAGFRMRN